LYDAEVEHRILEQLDHKPPKGYTSWTGGLIAEALGINDQQVWKVLKKHKIHIRRRRSWCMSTDPEFSAKAADIVGLYISPPDNAIVLCVDEKPSIQALDRRQGYLKFPDGRTMTGFSHEYKRNGTTTLFAALQVATGMIKVGHYNRRRRIEFLDFMNDVVASYPDKELHVILDKLSTHKPKNDQWLAKHPKVHFNYTPTHASWLNMVEVWFGILWQHVLRGGSFTSPAQLRNAIDQYIEVYNERAHPFHWTKTEVGPKSVKDRYTDLPD